MKYREADYRFVAETLASTPTKQKEAERLLLERPELMDDWLEDPRVFQRLWSEEKQLLRVSPFLLFQVLLRQVRKDLRGKLYLYEVDARGHRLPIFEAPQVASLLQDEGILEYLAEMLASFTRTESAVIYWLEGGQWHKKRFSDIDIDDVVFLARLVEPALRPLLIKRAADIALFLSGIFPDHASLFIAKPKTALTAQRTIRDYETEGSNYYKLAAEQLDNPQVQRTCRRLAESFTLARRALNTLSDQYLSDLQERLKNKPLIDN